jgi:hypothetical protein
VPLLPPFVEAAMLGNARISLISACARFVAGLFLKIR